jgi:NAD(P)H dehydrogenase (quinone)
LRGGRRCRAGRRRPRRQEKNYDITGPEPLSGGDLAQLASDVSGKPVEPVAVDDDAFVAGLVEHAGLPEPVAQFIASFGRAAREGQLAASSDAVERLTGSPPQSFRELLEASVTGG